MVEHIPSIISAAGVIAAAWFSYNQYTKNKMTDIKIEKWKKEEKRKSARRSENIAQIYGEIWELLRDFKADRVYIIQPHPLINSMFLSVGLEVRRNGVSAMKRNINRLPMAEVAVFSAELAKCEFKLYRDIETEVKDKRAKALLHSNGSASAIIRRLSNDRHDWIGSIICDFTRRTDVDPTYARDLTNSVAERIQYILPELEDEYDS